MRQQNIPHYNFARIFGFKEPKRRPRVHQTAMAFLYYNGWTLPDLAKSELGVHWKTSKQMDANLPIPETGWYSVNLETDLSYNWARQVEWGNRYGVTPLPAILTASIVTYAVANGFGDLSNDCYAFNTADVDADEMIYRVEPTRGQKWRLVQVFGYAEVLAGMAFGRFLG